MAIDARNRDLGPQVSRITGPKVNIVRKLASQISDHLVADFTSPKSLLPLSRVLLTRNSSSFIETAMSLL
ncbi:hypothetical protein KEM48_007619 [Puccinia striiformis f. sp. tritici PST-130]|nr:hypothetical protein H4Q26_007743 [Puccinia striiformis f. sp. tritici PST-130]KAI9621690.1 hypothetical protein KEM48_007619 [Puccinia striiformis f. sp. tritici PST-130]